MMIPGWGLLPISSALVENIFIYIAILLERIFDTCFIQLMTSLMKHEEIWVRKGTSLLAPIVLRGQTSELDQLEAEFPATPAPVRLFFHHNVEVHGPHTPGPLPSSTPLVMLTDMSI